MARGKHAAEPPKRRHRGSRVAAPPPAEQPLPPATRTPSGSSFSIPATSVVRPRRRRLWLPLLLVGVLAAAAAVAAIAVLTRGEDPEVAAQGTGDGPAATSQDTLLLVRHGGGDSPATGLTLLAADPAGGGGVVLFLPVGTLADIPGVGLDRLGLAFQYGGSALVQATVENLLGIRVDEVAAVDDASLGTLLGSTGGIAVEVPERLVVRADDGSAEVRFEAGEQALDGPRLAEYWAFVSRGEDELASFPRQQQVLDGFLADLADPALLEAATGTGLPALDTGADPTWVRGLLGQLAAARSAEALRVTLLPVESFGGQGPDGGSTFRPRAEAVAALVDDLLRGSVPEDGEGGTIRIQVLNGVGVPGVGQLVDRRLGGGSFRVVLTDNARDFDFAETRILVYDESAASMEAAQRVRERLGVGTIQVSRQPQSVVDLTIVVGADLLAGEPTSTATPDPEQE